MTEPAPPAPSATPKDGRARTRAASARALRRLARDSDAIVQAIDGLLHRIDSVWDESPDTLAMLVVWSDALVAQRHEIEDWQRAVGHSPERPSRARQVGRGLARDIALVFGFGRRLRRLAEHGDRLLALQGEAASRADDEAHRALFARHRDRTEREVARVRERLAPGA